MTVGQTVNVRIDQEFRSLIPPLSTEEREQLEENIRRDGCRDPLVTWRGLLLDGHHRWEICDQLGIDYATIELDHLADRTAATVWIIRNQFGRRNITLASRCKLAEALAAALAPGAKENQKVRKGKQAVSDNSVKIDGVDPI